MASFKGISTAQADPEYLRKQVREKLIDELLAREFRVKPTIGESAGLKAQQFSNVLGETKDVPAEVIELLKTHGYDVQSILTGRSTGNE